MKKILITGKGSYLGTNVKKHLEQFPKEYFVEELDMMHDSWKQFDFRGYDVIFHVAGLAHSTPDKSQRDIYYKVNTDLTYDVALKAKLEGVKQFIFMSSIIVYGSGNGEKVKTITKDTKMKPDNFYGDSKKQAELKIKPLENEKFKILIVRPPMIYGPGSKGNYPLLAKFAKKTPIFPTLENERSVLFLGNLIEFIKMMIDNEERGVYLPQNSDYVSSRKLIYEIAKTCNHKIRYVSIFNLILRLMRKQKHINKIFGSLIIEKKLSEYKQDYNVYTLEESIKLTERIF